MLTTTTTTANYALEHILPFLGQFFMCGGRCFVMIVVATFSSVCLPAAVSALVRLLSGWPSSVHLRGCTRKRRRRPESWQQVEWFSLMYFLARSYFGRELKQERVDFFFSSWRASVPPLAPHRVSVFVYVCLLVAASQPTLASFSYGLFYFLASSVWVFSSSSLQYRFGDSGTVLASIFIFGHLWPRAKCSIAIKCSYSWPDEVRFCSDVLWYSIPSRSALARSR